MMPDFTVETAWVCASNFYSEIRITGSRGDRYVLHWGRLPESVVLKKNVQCGWQCTCVGHKFRGTCKHVRAIEAADERCRWNAEMDPSAECARDADGDPCCPQCGGPVRSMQVMV